MKSAGLLLLLLALMTAPSFGQKANRKPVPKPRQSPHATKSPATEKPAEQSGFRIGIHITDSHETKIGGGAQFGIDQAATFCVDSKIGESYLPPNPPAGLPDLRFVNPRNKNDDCFDLGINNDFRPFRSPDQTDTFKVQFQAPTDGYPLTISWDDLTKYFNGAVSLRYPLSGKSINVDMKKKTSVTVPEEIPSFFIIASKPALTAKKK